MTIRAKTIYTGRLFPVRSHSPRAPSGTLHITITEPGHYQFSIWDMQNQFGPGKFYSTSIQRIENEEEEDAA